MVQNMFMKLKEQTDQRRDNFLLNWLGTLNQVASHCNKHGPMLMFKPTFYLMIYNDLRFKRTSPCLLLSASKASLMTQEERRHIPAIVFPQNWHTQI